MKEAIPSREEPPKVETSEALAATLRREVEDELQGLVRRLAELEAGDEARLRDLEQAVLQAVFALGRRWLGAVLAWRTAHERAPAHREGACGHRQRLVGWRAKGLLTLLGAVEWSRPYYQCQGAAAADEGACGHGEAPADAALGVVGRRTSAGVQEAAGYLAAALPLEEVAGALSRLLPLRLSARPVLELVQPVGEALRAREDAQVAALAAAAMAPRTAEPAAPAGASGGVEPIPRLYVEVDGVMARLRRGSVPLEAHEAERAGDVYREVKVGAVFAGARGPERSTLAPGAWVDTVDAAGPTRYVARRTSAEAFGPLLYALAGQAGLERAQEVVVLGDGAAWIWRLAEEQFPDAVQIVDLYHALQHVWDVAHAAFGRGTPDGAAWAEAACDQLARGAVEELVAAIRALPPVPPEPGKTRSVPEIEADYFTTNAARMRYPAFRARGLQVGSGIAEAGCKTVVTVRAKRAGMRWTPEGLDALLPLRTATLNGTYDAFWAVQTGVLT